MRKAVLLLDTPCLKKIGNEAETFGHKAILISVMFV
jgi:hypothetical protein